MRLSASLAFYTALSLAPLVIIVVGVAGLITERQRIADQLAQQIGLIMGLPSQQLVHTILATTEPQGGTLAAMIGIVTLVIAATAVFGEPAAALNLIWEVKPKPINGVWANLWSWLRQRFFAGDCARDRLPPAGIARCQRRSGWCGTLPPGARADADAAQPWPGGRRLDSGHHLPVRTALQIRAGCRDPLA